MPMVGGTRVTARCTATGSRRRRTRAGRPDPGSWEAPAVSPGDDDASVAVVAASAAILAPVAGTFAAFGLFMGRGPWRRRRWSGARRWSGPARSGDERGAGRRGQHRRRHAGRAPGHHCGLAARWWRGPSPWRSGRCCRRRGAAGIVVVLSLGGAVDVIANVAATAGLADRPGHLVRLRGVQPGGAAGTVVVGVLLAVAGAAGWRWAQVVVAVLVVGVVVVTAGVHLPAGVPDRRCGSPTDARAALPAAGAGRGGVRVGGGRG